MATAKKAPAKKSPAKKAPAKKTSARTAPDAIALLVKDHKDVKALFKQYAKLVKAEADDDQKKEVAETICTMLTIHATVEEEIFYPAARDALDEEDLLDEAEVEHASAKTLIAQIQAMEPSESLYDAKVTVLGEYIDHHVEEEEGEMFPKCKKAKMDLGTLGTELRGRKEALMAEMTEGSTPA